MFSPALDIVDVTSTSLRGAFAAVPIRQRQSVKQAARQSVRVATRRQSARGGDIAAPIVPLTDYEVKA